jgi:hypothetical protein
LKRFSRKVLKIILTYGDLNNLAYSKFKLKKKRNKDLFFKALHIRDSLQLTSGIITSKINISEYFMSEKDTVKARVFAEQALELSQKIKELSCYSKFIKTIVYCTTNAQLIPRNTLKSMIACKSGAKMEKNSPY